MADSLLASRKSDVRICIMNNVYHPLTILYCAVGLLTNIINVAVLTRPPMQNSWNFLMTSLAISDMIFLLSRASWSVLYYIYPAAQDYVTYYTLLFNYGAHMMESSAMLSSEFLNATIGVWRLMAIKWPVPAKKWCSIRRAKIAVAVIATLSILLNVPNEFIEQSETFDWNGTNVTLLISVDMQTSTREVFMYLVLLEVSVALPVLTAIGTTSFMIKKIYIFYKNRQVLRADDTIQGMNRTTVMLTIMLGLFILTNIPTAILFFAYYTPLPEVLRYRNLFLLLQGLDKATNFFVYFILSCEYRRTFRNLFSLPKAKPSTNCSSNSRDQIIEPSTSVL